MNISMSCCHLLNRFGIEQGFSMMRAAGFDSVEFNFSYWLDFHAIVRRETQGNFFTQSDEALREYFTPYRDAALRLGLRFGQAHAPFPTLVNHERTNADVLEAIRKSIMLCGFLGCRHLVIHPAFLDYNETLGAKEQWERNLEIYGSLTDDLKRYDVIACMENIYTRCNTYLIDAVCCEMSEVNAYMDALNARAGETRFGFCLDTGHALLTRNDVYLAIATLGERLQALHINDNDGVRDLHQAPYMGILDWGRFLRGLREVGYQGDLCFETEPTLVAFGDGLTPECLRLMAATGRSFAQAVMG